MSAQDIRIADALERIANALERGARAEKFDADIAAMAAQRGADLARAHKAWLATERYSLPDQESPAEADSPTHLEMPR